MNKINPLVYLLSGSAFIIFSIYLVTRPAIWEGFDYSQSGQIGDTIGGISAPIINAIGALLVFFSFKEQYKANILQREALNAEVMRNKENKEFDLLFSLFKEVKKELDNFEYVELRTITNRFTHEVDINELRVQGAPGIEQMLLFVEKCNSKGTSYNLTAEKGAIKYILGSLDDLLLKISESELSEKDKKLLINKIYFFYQAKLEEVVEILTKTDFKDESFKLFIDEAHNRLKTS